MKSRTVGLTCLVASFAIGANAQARVAQIANDVTFKTDQLEKLTARLALAGVAEPDFASMINRNTERLKQILRSTPRSQLGPSAKRISDANNQVLLQRDTFGLQVDNLMREINSVTEELQSTCQTSEPDLLSACKAAAQGRYNTNLRINHVRSLVRMADVRFSFALREQSKVLDQISAN